MKGLIKTFVLVILVSMVVSCKSDSKPNYQFFPNMYESPSYETYREYDIFNDEQSALLPAEGTLARGYSFFEYKNTNEGYERAKAELLNPLDASEINLENRFFVASKLSVTRWISHSKPIDFKAA